MSKTRMKKAFPVLKVLKKLKTPDLEIILTSLNDENCEYIIDLVHNALYNKTINNRSSLRSKLIKDKANLRYLTSKKRSLKNKRKRFKQMGGSLALILTTLLPLVADLIFKK